MIKKETSPIHVTKYNQATQDFELVETVERKTQRRGGYTVRMGRREWAGHYSVVSYKGHTYQVFNLPACYGDRAGLCIDIAFSYARGF